MTRAFVVIGDPVSHSLSPLMHSGWIADHELDATYAALQLRAEDPVAAIRALTGFAGANVTAPHKEAAARAAGSALSAANTLVWNSDGGLTAYNTDGDGFIDSLDAAAPDWRQRVCTALIVGAGGAARDIGKAVIRAGVQDIAVVNRTVGRALAAVQDWGRGKAHEWSALESGFAAADLIVNTTTLGMAGAPAIDWPVAACQPGTMIADIVYRPLETPLLAAARARGLQTVDGLGMLIHQGARAFEIWFGVRPDAAAARARLLQALAS
ncbi:MAG: shikimate dehydrogenase [Hyphomonadaceae bacterium]